MVIGLLYVFYRLLSRQYNTDIKRNHHFNPDLYYLYYVLKEVLVMKNFFVLIREFLEQYYASFAVTGTCAM